MIIHRRRFRRTPMNSRTRSCDNGVSIDLVNNRYDYGTPPIDVPLESEQATVTIDVAPRKMILPLLRS